MIPLARLLRREARVACSLKAQPLWLRIIKWTVLIAFVSACHDRAWFWPVIGVLLAVALTVHFLYRWQTHGWTQPWGGWNDLAAGRS